MIVLYVRACRVPLAAQQGMADDQGSETAGVEQENVTHWVSILHLRFYAWLLPC